MKLKNEENPKNYDGNITVMETRTNSPHRQVQVLFNRRFLLTPYGWQTRRGAERWANCLTGDSRRLFAVWLELCEDFMRAQRK